MAYNPKSGDASVLRITNAGPYSGERKLDVSRASAESLGFKNEGVAHLVVSVLKSPTLDEASYVKYHVYRSVPGHLGKFETFDLAYTGAKEKLKPVMHPTADTSVEADMEAVRPSEDELIPKPRPAVSPYFARELVMLRVPPRPIMRARLASDDQGSASAASPGIEINFGFGLRKFLTPMSIPTQDNE